jgi:O-antigen/teichoic acid export membrane protein
MAFAFAASDMARAVVAFVTSLVVARGFGVDEFGRWMLCLALASAVGIALDLGYGVLLTREAARDRCDLGELLAGAVATRVLLFLPVGGAVIAGGVLAGAGSEFRHALGAVVALAGAAAVYGCFAAVLRGHADGLPAALGVDIAGSVLQCALAVRVAAVGGTYAQLLWWFASVQGAQLLAAAAMWRSGRSPDQELRLPARAALGPLLARSWPFALSGMLANAQMRVAPLALGALATAGDIASFGVAWRIGQLVKVLPHAAFAAALPAFARTADAARLRLRFDSALAWFAAAAAAAVGAGAAPFVRFAYGDDFGPASVPLMWIGGWMLPSLVNGGRRVYLIAIGNERTALRSTAAALAAQAAGCAALVPAFGASGAAAAMAIGEAVVWWPLRAAVVSHRRDGRKSAAVHPGVTTGAAPTM